MALTDISHPTDIAMLTDLYELTMAQGLWESGKANEQGCFTAFYRDHPFGSAYAVMCGTAELPELVENLRFTPEDIDYLASLQAPAGGAMFKPAFLDYLRNFRAHVNIDAVPEGELVFPREPMVRVTGPSLECQLLETALLNIVGFQTLVATKTARRPPLRYSRLWHACAQLGDELRFRARGLPRLCQVEPQELYAAHRHL